MNYKEAVKKLIERNNILLEKKGKSALTKENDEIINSLLQMEGFYDKFEEHKNFKETVNQISKFYPIYDLLNCEPEFLERYSRAKVRPILSLMLANYRIYLLECDLIRANVQMVKMFQSNFIFFKNSGDTYSFEKFLISKTKTEKEKEKLIKEKVLHEFLDKKIEDMNVYNCIEKIIKSKKEAGLIPAHATYFELLCRCEISENDLKEELNNLVSDKKIAYGRTLNDIYFYICE